MIWGKMQEITSGKNFNIWPVQRCGEASAFPRIWDKQKDNLGTNSVCQSQSTGMKIAAVKVGNGRKLQVLVTSEALALQMDLQPAYLHLLELTFDKNSKDNQSTEKNQQLFFKYVNRCCTVSTVNTTTLSWDRVFPFSEDSCDT